MVKEGYKETEIGVIPKDWGLTSAKNLMKIETGSRNTEHKSDNGKYLFFVRSQQVERIDSYHYDCEAVLTAGDGVGTGKVFHYINGKFDAHQRVYVMSQFKDISGRFFYNYFKENFGNEVAKYTAKSSVDSVRRDMIAEMLIPVPSPEEQQKIAEALSDMDNLISSLEKLIEKKKAIKQACLQKMFPKEGETTPEMRFPGFTEPWEQRKLSEFVEFFSGLTYTPNDVQENGTLVLRSSNVSNGEVVDANNVYVNPQVVNSENVKVGDIVVVVRNGSRSLIGKHAQIKGFMPNTVIGAFMTGIRSECPEFTNALLNTSRFEEEIAMNMGATINQITGYMFSKMEFKVPCLDEQKKIGEYFEKLDNLITLHQRKLEKCKKIKQGMMQQLLTGKIRLI